MNIHTLRSLRSTRHSDVSHVPPFAPSFALLRRRIVTSSGHCCERVQRFHEVAPGALSAMSFLRRLCDSINSGMISRTRGEATMAQLQVFVLGPPRLEREGQPIELNLRKALALLVYLAVSGQPHSRDALATMLWPESDGREGRARLRRTLHRLNEAIGDHILDSGPDAIRLHPAANLWLDCAALRQHATAGLAAAAQDRFAPERLGHLSAAVELYTEDFLAGFTLPDS